MLIFILLGGWFSIASHNFIDYNYNGTNYHIQMLTWDSAENLSQSIWGEKRHPFAQPYEVATFYLNENTRILAFTDPNSSLKVVWWRQEKNKDGGWEIKKIGRVNNGYRLGRPQGIVYLGKDGNNYHYFVAADPIAHRIRVLAYYPASGELIPYYSLGDNQVISPIDVTFSPSDSRIWVVDDEAHNIQSWEITLPPHDEYTIKNKTIYGDYGFWEGKFTSPQSITHYNDGTNEYIYVCDTGNNRIVRLIANPDGTLTWVNTYTFSTNIAPISVAAVNYGIYKGIFVFGSWDKKIHWLRPDLTGEILSYGGSGVGAGKFTRPVALSIDKRELCATDDYINGSGIQYFRLHYTNPNPDGGGGGGNCPFLYVSDGADYILDNNVLRLPVITPVWNYTDLYKLTKTPVPINSSINFKLKELGDNYTYIDKMEVITIDHPADVDVDALNDTIVTFKKAGKLEAAYDNFGVGAFTPLKEKDGDYFIADSGDYINLRFSGSKGTGTDMGGYFVNTMKPHHDWIEYPPGVKGTSSVKYILSRRYPSGHLVRFPDFSSSNLYTYHFGFARKLDEAALVQFQTDPDTSIEKLPLQRATLYSVSGKSPKTSVSTALEEEDGNYIMISPDSAVDVSYRKPLTALKSGYVRDYFVKLTGRTELAPGAIGFSDKKEATAWNNARRLIPYGNNIYLLYSIRGMIYCVVSEDEGKTWEKHEYVGGEDAQYPAGAVDYLGRIWTFWVEYKNKPGLKYTNRENGKWQTPETFTGNNFMSTGWSLAPSIAIDLDTLYLFTEEIYEHPALVGPKYLTNRWFLVKFLISDNGLITQNIEIVDSLLRDTPTPWPPPEPTSSPSIDVVHNKPYLAYDKDGEIWYAVLSDTGWERYNLSNTTSARSIEPMIDVNNYNINVVWEEETFPHSGIYKLQGASGYIGQIPSKGNMRFSSVPIDIRQPVVIANKYLYWSGKDNQTYNIYRSKYDELYFRWGNPEKVSNIDWSDASYPQVLYYRPVNYSNGRIGIARYSVLVSGWGEGKEPYIMLKAHSEEISQNILLALNLGQAAPSPFTIQRTGYINYNTKKGNDVYKTVDYDTTELIYKIKDLDPNKDYRIKVGYYQASGHKWKEKLIIDKTPLGEKWFPSGEIIWVEKPVPVLDYIRDGEIEVHIKKIKGDYAVCGILYLYEKFPGKPVGKMLTTIIRRNIPYDYQMSIYPNPSNGNFIINYAIPIKGNVKISLYDVMGRMRKIIANEDKIFAGYYRIKCNENLPSGIYFLRFTSGSKKITRKMILIN